MSLIAALAVAALLHQSRPPSAFGSLSMVLPADTLRSRGVRVEADIAAQCTYAECLR